MGTEIDQETIRHVSDRTLCGLHLISRLARCPALCIERNGRGEQYCTLRYAAPGAGAQSPRQRTVYLGRLSDQEVGLLKGQIRRRWAYWGRSSEEWSRRMAPAMRTCKAHRSNLRAAAVKEAERLGLYLHGYTLRRRAGRRAMWNGLSDNEQQGGLRKLESLLGAIQQCNYKLFQFGLLTLRGYAQHAWARCVNAPTLQHSRAGQHAAGSLRQAQKAIAETHASLAMLREEVRGVPCK